MKSIARRFYFDKLYNALRAKPYYLSHSKVIVSDLLGKKSLVNSNDACIQEAMNWLKRAQDIHNNGGVSAGYNFKTGWQPPYPETTGYIIPTFFDYYRYIEDEEYRQRAISMADWEVSIQLDNGAFQGGYKEYNWNLPLPVVFDTGQVMFGLIRTYKETGKEVYLNASKKAGDWLVKIQDYDGAWRKYTFNEIPHSYNSRVAWALLRLYEETRINSYKEVAEKKLEWVLKNRLENGWFENCTFEKDENPYTHMIAYTIRGLLESGLILKSNHLVNIAIESSKVLLEKYEELRFLPGTFDEKWASKDKYCCLTGNAQMSIIWLKAYNVTKDTKFLDSTLHMNHFLKSIQDLTSSNNRIRGGIKGSYPIWGKYDPFFYPNWATKFFVDALLAANRYTIENRKDADIMRTNRLKIRDSLR